MTLKTDMTDDLDVFFDTDEFAETITYNSTSISAVVEYGEKFDERSGLVVATAEIEVKVSDVADPADDDTAVIGSNTWYYDRILSGDGYVWKLQFVRDRRLTFR